MKLFKIMIAASLLLAATGLYAQSKSKVIAVVNQAAWCHVCQENGARVMTEVLASYKTPLVTIAANDLTNEKTKEASKAELQKLGVYQLVANEKGTGQIILIDRKSKKVVNRISVAKSSADLKAAFNQALSRS